MPQPSTVLGRPALPILDRPTVQALAQQVGGATQRVAAAWLRAYDAARACGVSEGLACTSGDVAWDRARQAGEPAGDDVGPR